MTDSIDIYSKYNVDVNKLTKDYQKFPLKKIPRKTGGLQYVNPSIEDFIYLYIDCNLSLDILAQYFNVSKKYINKLRKMYNVKKSQNQIIESVKKTNLAKFGVENPFQSPIIKEKIKQTNLQLFGVENPNQSPIIQEKSKQTCREKYGTDYYLQTEDSRIKSKQTCIEKYGVEHYSQTDECKEKKKQTCLKHFGVEYPGQSPIIMEKMEQTCLERHGAKHYTQTNECKEKTKQTCIKRYGVENYSQSDEYKNLFKDKEFVKQVNEKIYKTKKKNNSFGKSKEEDKIYNTLLTKFKEVKRQYKSDLYPYSCDFYIPEKDLYIEYQGYWQHGFEPYLGTDEQNKIVESWENKNTEQYSSAIKTWTVRDPQKRNTAKQNNLNWLEFFTMEQFMKWFENL